MSTQIHDLGYRPYTGERAGVGRAILSLVQHSIRRALGLKRSGRHKIAPAMAIFIAFAPAVAMVGFAAFLGADFASELIGTGDYFGATSMALFLFAAAVVPGVVTTDRTNGMLSLYLASPLTRSTYVLAKALGIMAVMLIVTTAPIVFLVVAYTLVGAGPDGFFGFVEALGRALLAGTLAAAMYTALSMFVSSIPRRWGLASLAIIAVSIVPSVLFVGLTEETEVSDWIVLGSFDIVTDGAWQTIVDDRSPSFVEAIDTRPGWVMVVATVGWMVTFAAATWWRYQRIEVER